MFNHFASNRGPVFAPDGPVSFDRSQYHLLPQGGNLTTGLDAIKSSFHTPAQDAAFSNMLDKQKQQLDQAVGQAEIEQITGSGGSAQGTSGAGTQKETMQLMMQMLQQMKSGGAQSA